MAGAAPDGPVAGPESRRAWLVLPLGPTLSSVSAVVYRDVTASGVRVRVAESGSGPTVLLLHGLFLDNTTWNGLRQTLAKGHRVVTPDLPGFGASEKPHPRRFAYSVDSFAEVVADLYAGLELGRATLVGHCLGGAVAITLAARHPELVSELALVAPLCDEPLLGAYGRLGLIPLIGSVVLKQLWNRQIFGSFLREQLGARELAASVIDAYYEAFDEPAARTSAHEALRALRDPRQLATRASGLRLPTLVACGSHDLVAPAAGGRQLARSIKDARLELLDAGHLPQEERPNELGSVMLRFLADVRGEARAGG
jgi:pimeloyl-ACP methyl ester carboxylesterase